MKLSDLYNLLTDENERCDFIKIDLTNGPLSKQGPLKDVYKYESTINGKPSWNSKSVEYQIWYDPAYNGVWQIGIFPGSYGIIAHVMGSIDDNNTKWHYYDYILNPPLLTPTGKDMSLICMNIIGKFKVETM